ncbi:glycosyltransferase family 2 protein [Paenibacillus sp. 598K]|uniref:glycosyltransferase family 2 protein n=1 Tax=Paenibacillus sp. 598K TaxID=1117987 RepID=UPI001625B76A|nr:glycosyltransferase family 2 protein [Paenibacillus sp. 598K]
MADWIGIMHAAGAALGVVLLGGRTGWQIGRGRRSKLGGARASRSEPLMPPLSIIIPARNEARNLKRLLPMLRLQGCRRMEIIVVDDGSTDDTARTASERGARVVQAPPLPAGWQGKSWACWNGAQAASGAWYIFLDADTQPEPGFVERIGALLRRQGGWVTLQPYHKAPTFREQWSLFFNIAVLAGSGALCPLPGRRRAFGPCAACWSCDYDSVDGHRAVRGAVLEHLELGERFRQTGREVSGGILADALRFRMYPEGWPELLRGWTKSIAIGAGASHPVYLGLSSVWMAALLGCALQTMAIPGLLAAGEYYAATAAAAGYGVACLSVRLAGRTAGSFRTYTSLFYPLFLLFFFGLFAYALLRSYIVRRVSWKGRSVDVR